MTSSPTYVMLNAWIVANLVARSLPIALLALGQSATRALLFVCVAPLRGCVPAYSTQIPDSIETRHGHVPSSFGELCLSLICTPRSYR
jgi:hypothetical protein